MSTAPGSTSRNPSFCGVESRIISASTPALTATVAVTTSQCTPPPRSALNASAWLETLLIRTTRASARPASTTPARLRTLLWIGLSRLLRGIAQATLTAFCAACPRPIAPYVAARMPTTTAEVLPWMPPGLPSSSPTIGNCASAEVRISSWSVGSPWSTKPSRDDAIRSSGRMARNE